MTPFCWAQPSPHDCELRRDCPGAGTYDKVVSCEMIEAVGHEHLRTYFSQIGRMLKPGGKAVIQVRCPWLDVTFTPDHAATIGAWLQDVDTPPSTRSADCCFGSGRGATQVIAQPDERYESYCRSSDFIREHIFPGGHLPR